jgi:replicative DNA helicase
VTEGRIPPHDIAAEEAVISASLLSADAAAEVLDLLKAEHFYADANRVIWDALSALYNDGGSVDTLLVANRLRKSGDLNRAGGAAELGRIVDTTPAVANIRSHAEIVWSMWRRRQLIAAAQWTAATGYNDQLPDAEYIAEADRRVSAAMGATTGSDEPEQLAKTLARVFERMSSGKSGSEVVPTGFRDLDTKLGGGFRPGDLIVVAGRPGMGKTALVDAIENNIAETPTNWVLPFSIEMSREQRGERKLCSAANVDLQRYRTQRLDSDDWSALSDAAARLSKREIHVDDAADCTAQRIAAVGRRYLKKAAVADGKLAAITVDYLQLMSKPDADSETLAIGKVTRALKITAKTLGLPIILVSQLNRGCEARQDKRPLMSDLRDSGCIEQDADAVLFVYRDEYYNAESEDKGIGEVIVAKQRNGPTGIVRLRFSARCAKWDTLAPGDYHDHYEDY